MDNGFNLESRGGPWVRVADTNVLAAAANFASGGLAGQVLPFAANANLFLISLTDIPTAQIPVYSVGEGMPNSVMFRFFGTDASNKTFSARIWGITKGKGKVGTAHIDSWEATLLAQLLATLGNITGVAGTLIDVTTDFEADTISLTYGASPDITINSPANDLRGAFARIDHLAFPIIAVEFDDGSSAASCNALYRFIW